MAKAQIEVLHLGGAFMEHFPEESAPSRLCFVNSEALMELFLKENILIWHLINEDTQFMS